MAKNARKSGPDLLALGMRGARDDMAAGRVPRHPPEAGEGDAPDTAEEGAYAGGDRSG